MNYESVHIIIIGLIRMRTLEKYYKEKVFAGVLLRGLIIICNKVNRLGLRAALFDDKYAKINLKRPL